MWMYLIIGFVIAMLVGPIMLLQPTQRQRYLAALRAKAQGLGMHVAASRLETADGAQCWFYSLPCPQDQELLAINLERKNYQHEIHLAGVWAITSGEKPPLMESITSLLEKLPESVMGFSVTANAAGLHWSEKGGETQLEALYELLSNYLQESAQPKTSPPSVSSAASTESDA